MVRCNDIHNAQSMAIHHQTGEQTVIARGNQLPLSAMVLRLSHRAYSPSVDELCEEVITWVNCNSYVKFSSPRQVCFWSWGRKRLLMTEGQNNWYILLLNKSSIIHLWLSTHNQRERINTCEIPTIYYLIHQLYITTSLSFLSKKINPLMMGAITNSSALLTIN